MYEVGRVGATGRIGCHVAAPPVPLYEQQAPSCTAVRMGEPLVGYTLVFAFVAVRYFRWE